MTKNQFLGRLRIERLRLNPTLPGWEGNKSLLRLAGTLKCNHRQPSNYPGQYLCSGRNLPSTHGSGRHTRDKPLTNKFYPLGSPKGPQASHAASPAPADIRSRQIHFHSFPRTLNRSSEEFTLSKIQVGTSTRLHFFGKEIN